MFESTTSLSIGITALPLSIIVSLLTVLSMYLYMKRQKLGEAFMDQVFTATLIGLVVYKFWFLLEQPSLLREPMQILTYSGGAYGLEAAFTFGIGWMIYQVWKQKQVIYIEWLFIGFIFYQIIHAVLIRNYGFPVAGWGFEVDGLRYFPLNLIQLASYLTLIRSLFIIKSKKSFSISNRITVLLIGIGIIQLVIESLKPTVGYTLFGFSFVDLVSLASIGTGCALIFIRGQGSQHDSVK